MFKIHQFPHTVICRTTFYKVHRRSHRPDDFHGFLLSIERSLNVPSTLLTFCNFNWIWTTQVICPVDYTGTSQNDICIDERAAAIILGLNDKKQLQWNSPEPVKCSRPSFRWKPRPSHGAITCSLISAKPMREGSWFCLWFSVTSQFAFTYWDAHPNKFTDSETTILQYYIFCNR